MAQTLSEAIAGALHRLGTECTLVCLAFALVFYLVPGVGGFFFETGVFGGVSPEDLHRTSHVSDLVRAFGERNASRRIPICQTAHRLRYLLDRARNVGHHEVDGSGDHRYHSGDHGDRHRERG